MDIYLPIVTMDLGDKVRLMLDMEVTPPGTVIGRELVKKEVIVESYTPNEDDPNGDNPYTIRVGISIKVKYQDARTDSEVYDTFKVSYPTGGGKESGSIEKCENLKEFIESLEGEKAHVGFRQQIRTFGKREKILQMIGPLPKDQPYTIFAKGDRKGDMLVPYLVNNITGR